MTDKRKNVGGLFNFTRDSYFERTARPIYAIVFLLPFIIFYEFGTLLINTDLLNQSQVRVAAFVWLQNFLEYAGLGSKLAWAAPPLAVVVILIALQLASRKKWSFSPGDIWPMAVECILLAVPLIVLSLFLNSPRPAQGDIGQFGSDSSQIQTRMLSVCAAIAEQDITRTETYDGKITRQQLMANIITGIGAGIYEELIFRLILICVLMMLFQDLFRLDQTKSIVLSVLVSAALFSAHHHIAFVDGHLAANIPFNWTEFLFRTMAGIYFAAVFAIRGFGITAGTHAFYDTIAVLINAFFFQQ